MSENRQTASTPDPRASGREVRRAKTRQHLVSGVHSSHDGGKRGGYGRIAVPGQPGPRCRAGNAATAVGEASIVEGNQERKQEMPAREAEERMLRLRRQRPLPARQAEEQMHRLRRQRSSKMPAWEAEEQMQRLRRQRPLPAREAEEPMLRLRRQRPLPAREAEEQMHQVSNLG